MPTYLKSERLEHMSEVIAIKFEYNIAFGKLVLKSNKVEVGIWKGELHPKTQIKRVLCTVSELLTLKKRNDTSILKQIFLETQAAIRTF